MAEQKDGTAGGNVFARGNCAAAHFTGDVRVAFLAENSVGDVSVYNVTFAPGARNYWHRHSLGQLLLCTSGTGCYQEQGQPVRVLRPGDVVEIPPDTDHWHGAMPECEFSHIGITPGMSRNRTDWGFPLTGEEYTDAVSGRR